MKEVFGEKYAGAYDVLYDKKDYSGEVDLIENVLLRYAAPNYGHRVLDLGCGTGTHSLELATRGHDVVGVDLSPSMLTIARAKASALNLGAAAPTFLEGDIRSVDAGENFDAAAMMFAVLGYLHDDGDVVAAMRNVRRHLSPGAIFLFDVWNGVAVLADRPTARIAEVEKGGVRFIRRTQVRMEPGENTCHVYFDLTREDSATGEVSQVNEEHIMRYFFENELRNFLALAGFELVRYGAMHDIDHAADETAWNAICVARALL